MIEEIAPADQRCTFVEAAAIGRNNGKVEGHQKDGQEGHRVGYKASEAK